MTATPAPAAHMHPGGLDEYQAITSARELRLHLHYGHDDETSGLDHETLVERHRQAHAGEDALQRGAAMGEAFAGLGRTIPEGAAVRRGGPSGQSSEGGDRQGATPAGPPCEPPSGPSDPAAQIAQAVMAAIAAVRFGSAGELPAVEAALAANVRKALESYR